MEFVEFDTILKYIFDISKSLNGTSATCAYVTLIIWLIINKAPSMLEKWLDLRIKHLEVKKREQEFDEEQEEHGKGEN